MANAIEGFERTPANFRALRDMVGIKQDEFAEIMGVDRSEVRRMDGGKEPISDLAWRTLAALLDEHLDWVADNMRSAKKREPDDIPVKIAYYRSFEDYDQDFGDWVQADLVARESAARLMELGYRVEFVYPPHRGR